MTDSQFPDGGISELALIGEVWRKRGHVIRVAVKDAGYGPAVDVREYLTAEAYATTDTRPQAKQVRAAMKGAKPRRTKADGYVGPTKAGFWLTPSQAEVLSEAIASALVVAETIGAGEEVSA